MSDAGKSEGWNWNWSSRFLDFEVMVGTGGWDLKLGYGNGVWDLELGAGTGGSYGRV